jgi:hypothetical protein
MGSIILLNSALAASIYIPPPRYSSDGIVNQSRRRARYYSIHAMIPIAKPEGAPVNAAHPRRKSIHDWEGERRNEELIWFLVVVDGMVS